MLYGTRDGSQREIWSRTFTKGRVFGILGNLNGKQSGWKFDNEEEVNLRFIRGNS